MTNKKYRLTDETIELDGRTLYRIEALKSFGAVNKGDKGGFIEKENNLSHYGNAWVFNDAKVFGNAKVYGNARVYGNAWVYDDARVSDDAKVYNSAKLCGKFAYKKGRFIGGMNGVDKVTNITDKTGTDYWDNQYVLGDYEITEIEDEKQEPEIIKLNVKKYKLIED